MELNQYIDHTLLRQGATLTEVYQLCKEAKEHKFAAVCVAPTYVHDAKNYLIGSDVKVCTVIGFPFGYSTGMSKTMEIEEAILDDADELDIVQNVSYVKNHQWEELREEMEVCLESIEDIINYEYNSDPNYSVKIKVILETGILTDEEIIECCKIYSEFGDKIHFMKTSTGFAKEQYEGEKFNEEKIKTIKLIRQNIPINMQIKASGGIRDLKFAQELIDAGATRLGCSAGVKLMEEDKNQGRVHIINDGIFNGDKPDKLFSTNEY